MLDTNVAWPMPDTRLCSKPSPASAAAFGKPVSVYVRVMSSSRAALTGDSDSDNTGGWFDDVNTMSAANRCVPDPVTGPNWYRNPLSMYTAGSTVFGRSAFFNAKP